MNSYKVIGMMSGTSLDGLDIACCQFIPPTLKGKANKAWEFRILAATTIRYSRAWKDKLTKAPGLSGTELQALHAAYGKYIGDQCRAFITKHRLVKIDMVASHGHTIFHQTENKFTFQLGDGNAIHAATGLPVVYDFRSLDVALGGQGAPLVPVGDRLLFGEYDVCLNLGGIANLSFEKNHQRVAFDVCYANMGLNHLAKEIGKEFDKDGLIASKGKVNRILLSKLDKLYTRIKNKRPALGREGFELTMEPLLDIDAVFLEDRMFTFCESIALEVKRSLPADSRKRKLLITGGGALNPLLVSLLRKRLEGITMIVVPDRTVIEYKEALVFGLLGVLRLRNEVNVLKSVTRASRDSCSGVVIGR